MTGWSFKVAKIFGVEVRLHSFFVLALVPLAIWAILLGGMPARGFALWFLLLLAVIVRETARSIVSACLHLDLKTLLLLPIGALPGYRTPEAEGRADERQIQRVLAITGPVANLLFAVIVACFVLTVAPALALLGPAWIAPNHLIRGLIWSNVALGLVHGLPAWPLDAGRVLRTEVSLRSPDAPVRTARMTLLLRIGWGFSIALMVAGVATGSWWMLLAGSSILIGAQKEREVALPVRPADTTCVSDVMLTDYTMLPASATLEDAMVHARHSLQDVFPVVRAGNMVGAVARHSIVEALGSEGNGYVQGIMIRTFQTADVDDLLEGTLARASNSVQGALQMMPVLAEDVVVGILTPQHLQRSLALLPRRIARVGRAAVEDRTE